VLVIELIGLATAIVAARVPSTVVALAVAVAVHSSVVKRRASVVLLGCLSAVGASLLSATATAAAANGASATFSGAVNGHLTTPATDCPGVTDQSGEIDFYHSLRGHSGNEWSLFFTAPHNGTWKPRGIAGSSSFSLEANDSISISWDAKSGSFTTKGTNGSVNITLAPEPGSSGHGVIHVKGSWSCP
jgi:hypothetical protein